MSNLTTHVLDTSIGKPAVGMQIKLLKKTSSSFNLLKEVFTNKDGRVDGPLIKNNLDPIGLYEFNFYAGDYFLRQKIKLPDIKFLDIVVIRFGISNKTEHYHVPLLISPYGYSTYRGS